MTQISEGVTHFKLFKYVLITLAINALILKLY